MVSRGTSRMVFASTRRIHFQWSGATLKRVRRTIQVRIFRGETKYVAECLDLPIVTEGDTLDEVTANIRESIGLHLEGEDLSELGLAPEPTILATIELDAVA
jgi:predicted RNase H-like HicB family nuclease